MTVGQDFIQEKFLMRTFNIAVGKSTGTTFLIEADGVNYFITAKHLLDSNEDSIDFYIFHSDGWQHLEGEVYFHSNSLVDLVVIKPLNLHFEDAIRLDEADITLGDTGFFLGYPYGYRTEKTGSLNAGFPFPLIKRANLSGVNTDHQVVTLWLDGHNNPGFSGGPVFFKKRDDPEDANWYLAGVISAYISQLNKLITPIGELNYNENSGIIIAIGAIHIKEIIAQIRKE